MKRSVCTYVPCYNHHVGSVMCVVCLCEGGICVSLSVYIYMPYAYRCGRL